MKLAIGINKCPICGEEFRTAQMRRDMTIFDTPCQGSTREVKEGKKHFLFCMDGFILTKKDLSGGSL